MVFFSGGSIDKDASFFILRAVQTEISGERQVESLGLVVLVATELVQFEEDVLQDAEGPILVVSALVDGHLLELGLDELGQSISVVRRNDFVLLALQEESWNAQPDLLVEVDIERVVATANALL